MLCMKILPEKSSPMPGNELPEAIHGAQYRTLYFNPEGSKKKHQYLPYKWKT